MTRRERLAAADAAALERAYVAEQLGDFGTGDWSADEAIREANERYLALEAAEVADALAAPEGVRAESAGAWAQRLRVYHRILFDGILTCAGHLRRTDDAWGGGVAFGGVSARTLGDAFEGEPPGALAASLLDALVHFDGRHADPVHAAALVYQRLVYAHPFYDANGRIARLIAGRWLAAHGLLIGWECVSARSGTWHTHLNKMHKAWRRGKTAYTAPVASLLRACVHVVPDEDAPFDAADG